MSSDLDHMPDDLVQPADAARHVGDILADAARHVGDILAGAALWQRYSPRVREGGDKETAYPPELDPATVSELTELLLDMLVERQIDCVLVGAVAMLQYVEGRHTKDIDFIMPKSELRRCPEFVIRHQDKTFCQATFGGLKVNFLYASHLLFKLVAEQYSHELSLGGRTLKCATPEGLVILKLFAIPNLLYQLRESKVGQYEADVRSIVGQTEVRDEIVLAVLEKQLKPGEYLVTEMILKDIRERIANLQRQREMLDGTGQGR